MKFYPYKKKEWGGGGGLAMLKGEHTKTKSFGVVLTQDLDFLAILKRGGGTKSIHPLKVGWGTHT